MRKILCFLGLTLTLVAKAQSWDLFPLGQKNNYLFEKNGSKSISLFSSDSSSMNGAYRVDYINSKNYPGKCYQQSLTFWDHSDIPDSVVYQSNKTLLYFGNKFISFRHDQPDSSENILLNASDTVIVMYKGTSSGITFNQPDSLRVYEFIKGNTKVQITWSKRFGLTMFIPFNYLYLNTSSTWKLINGLNLRLPYRIFFHINREINLCGKQKALA